MAWVVTPSTQPPVSTTGWVTSPTTTTPPPQQGWLGAGTVTVNARPSGNGTLTLTPPLARPFLNALLVGDGALFTALIKREFRLVNLSGDSDLRVDFAQIQQSTPQFTSTGFLFGDSVSTHMEPQFSGGGSLAGYTDGLTAVVGIGYGIDVAFTGEGNYLPTFESIYVLFSQFAGDGTLSSTFTPKLMADLVGSGQLSAPAFAVYARVAALLGSGALSATRFEVYLRSIGFTAPGSLTALFLQMLVAAEGGTGTVSAQIKQIYAVTGSLTGDGALSALMFTGIFAGSVGVGSLSAVMDPGHHYTDDFSAGMPGAVVTLAGAGSGALSATVLQSQLVGLSGAGTLSATAVGSYPMAVTDLSGTGTLSASVVWQVYDDFNRADSTTSAGPAWTNRLQTVGIVNNTAYAVTVPNVHCVTSHVMTMPADDMEATITIGPKLGATPNEYAGVLIGYNSAGQGAFAFISNGAIIIYSNNTNWISGPTSRVQVNSVGFVTGDKVTIRRIGNVYQARKNGVDIAGATWTDSGNVIPRDSSHRFVGCSVFNPLSDVGGRTIEEYMARPLNYDANLTYFSGGGTLTATATRVFTPFTEENVVRSNQPTPSGGCIGCWVTLIGAGGSGGSGARGNAGTARTGGGGGGGGAFIPRVFVPIASLGATYSIGVQTNQGVPGTARTVNGPGVTGGTGFNSTFVSGSVNMVAGGGGGGTGGAIGNTTAAGGAGGTVSGATGVAGTAGGNGGVLNSGASQPTVGVNNGTSNSGGAGGGGAGGMSAFGSNGDGVRGGSTNGQAGGAGGFGNAGGFGSDRVAGVASSGGGGGAAAGGGGYSGIGGYGQGYGGGAGGGGAGWDGQDSSHGGFGSWGYSKVEWVDS